MQEYKNNPFPSDEEIVLHTITRKFADVSRRIVFFEVENELVSIYIGMDTGILFF